MTFFKELLGYLTDKQHGSRRNKNAHRHDDLSNVSPNQHNDTKIRSKEVDESNLGNDKILVYKSSSGKLEYEDKPSGSGTPATTVVEETYFGQSPIVGTDTKYARSDHSHGTPVNPVTGHESSYDHADLISKKHSNTLDHAQNTDTGTSASDFSINGTNAAKTNDSRFVTNGDSHDHNGEDGATVDHVNLNNKGTNTHSQIDSHISAASSVHNFDASGDAPPQNHAATKITSGTLDGDRLPALSTTKRGGVPATGTPSGKYLKDDDSWADPPGGTGLTHGQVMARTIMGL